MRQDYIVALALVAFFPSVIATPIEARASGASVFKPTGMFKPTGTPPSMPTGGMMMHPLGTGMPSAHPSGSGTPPKPYGAMNAVAARAVSSSSMKMMGTGMPSPMRHENGTGPAFDHDAANGTHHMGQHNGTHGGAMGDQGPHNGTDAEDSGNAAFINHAAVNGTHHKGDHNGTDAADAGDKAQHNGGHHKHNGTSKSAGNGTATTNLSSDEAGSITEEATSSTTTSTSAAGKLGITSSVLLGLVAMVGATLL